MAIPKSPVTQKQPIYEESLLSNEDAQNSKTRPGCSKQTANQLKEIFSQSSGISGVGMKEKTCSAQKTFTALNIASSTQNSTYASNKQDARAQMKSLSDKINKPEMLKFPDRKQLGACVQSYGFPDDSKSMIGKVVGPLTSQFANQGLTQEQVNQKVHKKVDEAIPEHTDPLIKEGMKDALPEVFGRCAKGQFGSSSLDDFWLPDLGSESGREMENSSDIPSPNLKERV